MIYRKASSSYFPHHSCDIFPKNNNYIVFFKEMDTFLPILTPGFAPLCPQNKVKMVIYQEEPPSHLPHLSCDLFHKNNIYTVFYREMGTFLPILTSLLTPFRTQNRCWQPIFQLDKYVCTSTICFNPMQAVSIAFCLH